MRSFTGPGQFDALKKTIVESYQRSFPAEKNGFKLDLKKIWVDEAGLDDHDYVSQKRAKIKGQTWGAPVYANLHLKDPSGKAIDKAEKIRLATIPKLTPRGSYIVEGNEYQISNQLLRKMGAYVVRKATGDQFKISYNLGGENTKNFEVHFDPATNKYFSKVDQGKIPLYPLLSALGVPDQNLRSAWGSEIFAANKKDSPKDIFKYAEKFARVKTDNVETAREALRSYIKKTVVDPHVTETTVGARYTHLHPNFLVDTSKKLLHVYQNKMKPDDPENLLFKEVLSVEDMLHDRLNHPKNREDMNRMLTRHLGRRDKIKHIIDFKKLTSPVANFFTRDDRSNTSEQYNPMHMLTGTQKLTIMGTGGIRESHMITPEVRQVHPSHVGFIDVIHTPESQKIGANLHLASGLMKDKREIKTQVINRRTGKKEWLTPRELYTKAVAFPDYLVESDKVKISLKKGTVRGQVRGQVKDLSHGDVDYILPSHGNLFSYSTNLIPFLQHNQGNRAMMGSKMVEQAIPLVDREAPLVQTAIKGNTTFHQAIGKQFSLHSDVDGKVKAVGSDYIKIGNKTIPIYNHFPLHAQTFIHHEPVVKVGDTVKKGQLIADSNFTRKGTLALGKNLNVAYLPYPGLTFEDGIVITESAAKKLSAQQVYQHSYETEPTQRIIHRRRFLSYYPNAVDKNNLSNIGDDGVIKKGSVVQPGHALILGLNYDKASPENATLRRINRALERPWANAAIRYRGEFPGIVTDVVKRGKRHDVYIKAIEPARESDKLSGLHGNKGVITRIIPDHEAPRMKDGTVPDVFLNPHGIISRINVGQIYESTAGKIAAKRGQPYIAKNFSGRDTAADLAAELKKHGITDKEEMFLPDGKRIGDVHVGKPYVLRLAKTGKTGFSARMPGMGYDRNMQPIKGGEEGAKNLDLMTFYSMLSHGSKKNLVDAYQKSERNDEYWHALEMGKPLPTPRPSFAYQKFISMLQGAGVNAIKTGGEVRLAPMTDAEVAKLSKGAINNPEFLYAKNLKPIDGGFFDPGITGGILGNRHGHIELHEPYPNPIFEGAIRTLTGLKAPQYLNLLSGKLHVDADGKLVTKEAKNTLTGGHGIKRLLGRINVDSHLNNLKSDIRKEPRPKKVEELNRKIRILSALKELNLKPEEAYVRTKIPVIPPVHRPVYSLPNGTIQASSANLLYQNVGILNNAHKHEVMKLLPESEKADLRHDTYIAKKALSGLEAVYTRGKDQPIKGFAAEIAGTSPKQGFFLNKVVTKRQDLVGRGVITAAPDLHVDQLGIPEKMAWTIFKPFVVREFVSAGYKPDAARSEIESKTELAKKMLTSTMNKRTVMMNRAPSLHKFSIMAFKPVLSEGLAVRVPPLVLKGFGGDFDGDAVSIHVPTSEPAIRESHRMFPSQNLFKPGTGELMIMPSQESAIGVYFLSQSAEGRKHLNKLLPSKYKISGVLTKKKARDLYNKIAKESPHEYTSIVNQLKQRGDTEAYHRGFSVGLEDVIANRAARDKIFNQADRQVSRLKRAHKAGPELDLKISDVYQKAAKESYDHIKRDLGKQGNNFYHMVTSGARGTDGQLMQLISAPGILKDARDRPIPSAVRTSYAEGLNTSDYILSMYGARKGMMDRALQTSAPGALSKDIMASVVNHLVTEHDCGNRKGAKIPIDSMDVHGRFLAGSQHGFPHNHRVTPQLVSSLKRKGIKQLTVRSPLNCLSPKGVCAHDFGHNEHDQLPEIGANVGAQMGQAMSEPLTQLTMRCTISTVIVKIGNKIFARSMEDIYDLIPSETFLQDGRETKKFPENSYIWDLNGWISASFMQRHKPDCKINFVKSDSGDAVLVQEDHPIYAYKLPVCECGYNKNTLRFENKGYSVFECSMCKRVRSIRKSTIKKTETVKTVSRLKKKEDSLWISKRLPEVKKKPPEINPYIIGFYLAEGCIRKGDKYKYKNKPVAIVLTQAHNEIKLHAEKYLKKSRYNFKTHEKCLTVYDTKLATTFSKLCPGLAHKKRMNFDVPFMPHSYLADILCGLIDGDGTIAKSGNVTYAKVYSSSFILIQQIATICFKLGIPYDIGKCTPSWKHKTQPYQINLSLDHNTAYTLKNSCKIAKAKKFPTTHQYKNPTTFGISEVRLNWSIMESDYEVFTYDVKTSSESFLSGFIRNHNTFHTGAVAGAGGISAKGFDRIEQLLKMPSYVAGEAAVSTVKGRVSKITKSPAGGFNVHIGDDIHPVRPGTPLKVKVGDHVDLGDPLSSGVIRPQTLVKYKGMSKAQNYIVDELKKAYEDQGVPIHRKVFETVIRSVGNLTRVANAPKHSPYLPGDLIPYTEAVYHNERRRLHLPTRDAVGYHLHEPIGRLPAQHEIKPHDVQYLKGLGYNKIQVLKDPIVHTPILKGVENMPMTRKDWMAQLGYRYIKKTLTDGSAQAWKTNVEGHHPIPAFAFGSTFGRKKEHY